MNPYNKRMEYTLFLCFTDEETKAERLPIICQATDLLSGRARVGPRAAGSRVSVLHQQLHRLLLTEPQKPACSGHRNQIDRVPDTAHSPCRWVKKGCGRRGSSLADAGRLSPFLTGLASL